MKASHSQNAFTLGEISSRGLGRYDDKKPIWSMAAVKIENFLVYQLGGALFRCGTQYAGVIKNSANKARLLKFIYSTVTKYAIETGPRYMRFWANGGQVVSGGSPVEISTVYDAADLANIQTAGKADIMYLVDGAHQPQKLQRLSAILFSIGPTQTIGGPFRDANTDINTTITPSSQTGATTLTVTIPAWGAGNLYVSGDWVTNGGVTYQCLISNTSTASFANDLANGYWIAKFFFRSGHVGSLYKVGLNSSSYGSVVIATVAANGLSATGNVQADPTGTAGNLGTASATYYWAEGAFSTDRGWPTSVVFHEGRLIYGGPGQFIYGSAVGAYDDFSVGGTNDSDAFEYELSSDQVSVIRWVSSNTTLQIGTSGGSYTAQSSAGTVGITPTSISITQDTNYSVQQIAPVKIAGYLYYIQGNSYNQRALVFDLYQNKQVGQDITLLADHILRDGGGALQMDKQQSPNDRVWIVRNDGQLAVLTRNAEQQIMAWSRLVAGSTTYGAGLFESVCILPNDGADDTVWVIVNRTINGVVTRCVEYFTNELFTNYYEPVCVDCSSTIDNPKVITAITKASPAQVTSALHGFSNGDTVKIDNVVGMTELNGNIYLVANSTLNTFTLTDDVGNAIDSSLYGLYISGGEVRKMFQTITGLDYLNGETVTVQVDGGLPAAQQTFLVAGGTITLSHFAAVAHIGLPYTGTLTLLPLGDGSQQGTGQTKLRKVYASVLRFWQSLGGSIGFIDQFGNISGLKPILYPASTGNVIPSHTIQPYTGDVEDIPIADYGKYVMFFIQQSQPLPMMILSVIITSEAYEK